MSIFNENGNYINLKDPLERMPYVMNEINMICNNYDYITEGINLNDIKNAIKKAWLKFKTFIVDALRSIKIKINDNTNKLLRYIEKNKTKVDELLKDKHINNYNKFLIELDNKQKSIDYLLEALKNTRKIKANDEVKIYYDILNLYDGLANKSKKDEYILKCKEVKDSVDSLYKKMCDEM